MSSFTVRSCLLVRGAGGAVRGRRPTGHRHHLAGVLRARERTLSTGVPSPELAASLLDPSLLVEDDFGATERIDVFDPATGDTIASVFDNGTDETHAAIDAAYQAGPEWSGMLAKQRSAVLEKWHDLMHEHVNDLAIIMTAECGKPLAESRGEVGYAASFLKWFAEEAKRASGDVIPHPMPGRRLVTIKQPVGVCGMVTPWNFPAAMITRKLGPALAAGCTAVVKPSEDTPLSALAVVELGRRAGVPRDAMVVVTGSKDSAPLIGTELATNTSVRKISFTGSTAVGKLLMAQSASTVKRVSLELGGNAPFIIFEDADLDAAVQGLIGSKFRNAGQTCVCANRIFVQDAVYDEFAAKFTAEVEQMTVGPGADPSTVIGPLVIQQPLSMQRIRRRTGCSICSFSAVARGRHLCANRLYCGFCTVADMNSFSYWDRSTSLA
eukprot:COSAG02_NODE_4423_length_5376_cov_8.233655_3_plen_438_part_00